MDNHAASSRHSNYNKHNLIWIDLEMTGINPDQDHIIEIALLITDYNLQVISERFNVVIHQPPERLANMEKIVVDMHTSNGLIDQVAASKVSLQAAEQLALEFVKQYVPDNASPMCGNSICLDRRFLFKYMPTVERHFHYRNLDVSTVKLLTQYWHPDIASSFKKSTSNHRAIDDILESIVELQFYRNKVFI